MKFRKLWFFILVVVLSILYCLNCNLLDPQEYTGNWYSAKDGTLYSFENGLIRSEDPQIVLSDTLSISGAYCFAKDSILLFISEWEELSSVSQLYIGRSRGTAVLRNTDNEICFYRDPQYHSME